MGESSSWSPLGPYQLGLDPQLGFHGYGRYAFETISLSDSISVPSQIVAVVNSTEYWLGYLGLGVQPTNFSSIQKSTFLSSMVENQSLIPSHSYGYTAGAHYRLKNVPASLTLGGFDESRFVQHDVSFALDPDQKPVVALNSIKVNANPTAESNASTSWSINPHELATSATDELYTIDSSTPYLWLPESICDNFAEALGLMYDTNLELYTFASNPQQHEKLIGWNMTFTFELTDLPGSANSVTLSLPYAAFDLQLTFPFPGLNATPDSTPVNYFPLRKATNSSQYTIGRAFLQETYLTVDYERNNFSISQALFKTNALNNQKLIDIARPKNSTFGGPAGSQKGHQLGAHQIGLIVGAVVLCMAVGVFLFIYRCRRKQLAIKKRSRSKQLPKLGFRMKWLKFFVKALHLPIPDNAFEVSGSTSQPKEVSADGEIGELGADDEKELEATETPSSTISFPYNKHPVPAVGHNPSEPAELYTPNPMARYEEHGMTAPSPTVPPPYKNSSNSHTTMSGVSSDSKVISNPSSPTLPSPALVSPLTPRFPRFMRWRLLYPDRPASNTGSRSSHGNSSLSERSMEYPSHWHARDDSPQQSPRRFSWEPTE